MMILLSCHWLRTYCRCMNYIIVASSFLPPWWEWWMMMASTQPQKRFCVWCMCCFLPHPSASSLLARGTQTDRLRFKTDLVGMRNSAHSILVKWCETSQLCGAGTMLHLCELWVIRCMALFRKTERLWENWLIAKTTFPSPRCHMSCSHLVGEMMGEQLCVSLFGLLCASWF